MQAHAFQLVLNTNGNFLAKVAHLIISIKNIYIVDFYALFIQEMNHPRIFINFVLVTSPLNPSLRPHMVFSPPNSDTEQAVQSEEGFQVFEFFTNRHLRWLSSPIPIVPLCRELYFCVDIESYRLVFSSGAKEQSIL